MFIKAEKVPFAILSIAQPPHHWSTQGRKIYRCREGSNPMAKRNYEPEVVDVIGLARNVEVTYNGKQNTKENSDRHRSHPYDYSQAYL